VSTVLAVSQSSVIRTRTGHYAISVATPPLSLHFKESCTWRHTIKWRTGEVLEAFDRSLHAGSAGHRFRVMNPVAVLSERFILPGKERLVVSMIKQLQAKAGGKVSQGVGASPTVSGSRSYEDASFSPAAARISRGPDIPLRGDPEQVSSGPYQSHALVMRHSRPPLRPHAG
jgi:hypothetical protein